MTIHDRVQELMMSLVVEDIADADRAFAEQHLRSCEQCRSDLDSLTAIVPVLADVGRAAPAPAPAMVAAGASGATVTAIGSSPRRRRGVRVAVAATLVAAASIVVLIVAIGGAERNHRSEVRLSRSDSITGGVVQFDELDDGVTVHLRMSGLREPPPGGMYEAWLEGIRGSVISVGSFSPTGTGDVSVTLHGAGHLADFDELIVTIEPDMVDPGRNGMFVVLTDLPSG